MRNKHPGVGENQGVLEKIYLPLVVVGPVTVTHARTHERTSLMPAAEKRDYAVRKVGSSAKDDVAPHKFHTSGHRAAALKAVTRGGSGRYEVIEKGTGRVATYQGVRRALTAAEKTAASGAPFVPRSVSKVTVVSRPSLPRGARAKRAAT